MIDSKSMKHQKTKGQETKKRKKNQGREPEKIKRANQNTGQAGGSKWTQMGRRSYRGRNENLGP